MDIVRALKQGNRRAVAKAITLIENDDLEAKSIIKKIFKNCGTAMVIGLTGPAGSGKSSLINKMAVEFRKRRKKTAILAVDPTSHLTGGAILGDRVRMTESTDSGVFIRSLASRGAVGAVSHSLRNCIRVLEYAGFKTIIIESVGAGQTEVEISNIADITVVVFNPHTGDNVQTIKAGLTEIGDIYLVNKSDLPGADQLYMSVVDFIGKTEKDVPVLKTSTKTNAGIAEFVTKVESIMNKKSKSKSRMERSKIDSEVRDIILNNVAWKLETMLSPNNKSYSLDIEKIQKKTVDPFYVADKLTKSILKK